jgi:hypothetical protein
MTESDVLTISQRRQGGPCGIHCVSSLSICPPIIVDNSGQRSGPERDAQGRIGSLPSRAEFSRCPHDQTRNGPTRGESFRERFAREVLLLRRG